MTVTELIVLLAGYPGEMQVAYQKYSEQCLLEPSDLEIRRACESRADGWVHDERPDKPSCNYLVFPGN